MFLFWKLLRILVEPQSHSSFILFFGYNILKYLFCIKIANNDNNNNNRSRKNCSVSWIRCLKVFTLLIFLRIKYRMKFKPQRQLAAMLLRMLWKLILFGRLRWNIKFVLLGLSVLMVCQKKKYGWQDLYWKACWRKIHT